MTPDLQPPSATFFLDPERRPRTVWRLAIFLIGWVVVQIIAAIAVILAVVILDLAAGRGVKEIIGGPELQDRFLELQGLSALPLVALLLLWIWICRRFLDSRSFVSVGFGAPRIGWPATVLWGFLAGALPILLSVSVLLSTGGIFFTGVTTSWQTWLLVPVLVLMAFSEEIVFRGYMLRNFLDTGRPVLGLVVSSLVFALAHGFNPGLWSSPWGPINLFGAGLVLAMAYLCSEDLWFPTVLHFAWNITQGVVFELPISGLATDGILDVETADEVPVWLTGGDFGLESSMLVTVAEVVLTVALFVLWRRRTTEAPEGGHGSPPLSGT